MGAECQLKRYETSNIDIMIIYKGFMNAIENKRSVMNIIKWCPGPDLNRHDLTIEGF